MRPGRALVLLAFVSAGSVVSASEFDDLINRSVDAGYRQQYDSAWALLELVAATDSLEPAVAFWQASLIQMLLYDSGDPVLTDSFYRASDRAAKVCERRIKAQSDDAGALILLGLTRLNRANCQSWQRDRLRAVFTLLSSESAFRRAAAADSTQADAWFGLGTVEYFKATASRYVFGLGLFGNQARAYVMIERALAGNGRLRHAALFFLAFMQKQDGLYEQALASCDRMLQRYPGNRSALRLQRDVRVERGDYAEAVELARYLAVDIATEFPDNRYGLAETRLALVKAWDGLAEPDSVRRYADMVIAWEPYQRDVPWLSDYVAEARRYRKKWDRR